MAAPKPTLSIGGKGSTLTSSDVFAVAHGGAKIAIESPATSSSSSTSITSNYKFSIPNFFTTEESKSSLFLLLNKLLLSSSASAAAADQILPIIDQETLASDYALIGVDFDQVTDYYASAAVDGVSAVIDYCCCNLSVVFDAVAAISCEALRVDASPFNLIDSGDGTSSKDAVAVARDFKVFFNGSKLVNSGSRVNDSSLCVAEIPFVHGNFRWIWRSLRERTRVQLNSGLRGGSIKDVTTVLSALASSLLNVGENSARRAQLVLENSISDKDLCCRLSDLFNAGCQRADCLEELLGSAQSALRKKDYLLFVHNVYELLGVVIKLVSWEAVTAFVALEGNEIFVEKIIEENGGEVKTDKSDKKKKKKKLVLGKGTTALLKFLKDTLLSGATTIDLEKCTHELIVLLQPTSFGFGGLLGKLKEIVESNESQRRSKVPKGTRDFSNEPMAVREKAFSIIVDVFKRHGAVALDTPVFELKETLMGKYGEDSKLIYDLADQGGELCSLRYDLTVPFARYVAMNGLTSFKRYQIGKVYRRDNPAKGRYREFYQCDFDIAGKFEKMWPDFEVIKILTELLDELGIGDYEVKLNHRKLLDGILELCGVPQVKFRSICSSIDKLDKQTFEQIKKEMVEKKGLTEETADKIGSFVKQRGSPMEMLSKLKHEGSEFLKNPETEDTVNELKLLFEALEKSKCIDKVVFDLSLARGLDYYTGVIFEAVLKGTNQVGSIAAGGRYDKLIRMFGSQDVPAVGISLGIERVFIIMEQLQKDRNEEIRATETQVLVSTSDDDLPEGAGLASELWGAKMKAELMINKKVSKRATDFKIPYTVSVGKQELIEGNVTIKDVIARTEEKVSRSVFVDKLQERLKGS